MLRIFKKKSSSKGPSDSGNRLLTPEQKISRKEAVDLARVVAGVAKEEAAEKAKTMAEG